MGVCEYVLLLENVLSLVPKQLRSVAFTLLLLVAAAAK